MREYRIAFFTVDWNYELVENTLHGLKQYTGDHPEVQICVFDCFGKDQGNDKDRSEYAVFRLPDLTRFDGIIIQGNQIVLKDARRLVAEKVAEAGIPAISVGCEMEGCALLQFDNRQAEYEMTFAPQFDKIIDALLKARNPEKTPAGKTSAGKRKKAEPAAEKKSTQA